MKSNRLTETCPTCLGKMKSGQVECYKCRRTRKAVMKETVKENTASNTGLNIAIEHVKKPGVVGKLFGIK